MVYDLPAGGVMAQAQYNTTESISGFIHASMKLALDKKLTLYMSTEDTIIPRAYDGKFKNTFQEIDEGTYKKDFKAHHLIDDMVARMIKSKGGYIIAMKIIHQYCEHQKCNETSTKPIASIYTWTQGLAKRDKLDNTPKLVVFTEQLEKACVDIVDADGIVTKDLALVCDKKGRGSWVTTNEYLDAVKRKLKSSLKE
ncbi:Isocitrate dehydrogenase [NADP], mitochondrial precursor (Oxalosuccinate decarboxylase) [Epicoccum nigrum]|nr:Isocitrate dehydrogenase [NADP], mitochondrial precursor (Oxalosuccinate decarboxylase) [Epicoccum nigrum]